MEGLSEAEGFTKSLSGGAVIDAVIESLDWQDFPDLEALACRALQQAFQAMGCDQQGVEISLAFVGAETSQTLNRDYRGKDKPTNILSFPLESADRIKAYCEALDGQAGKGFHQGSGVALGGTLEGRPPLLLGDLVVCRAVLKAEALEQQKSEYDHLCHLLVHGFLHCLGFDHITEEEAVMMENKEKEILKNLNIADPYQNEGI